MILSSGALRTVAQSLDFVRRSVCPEHAETALGALLLVTGELVTNAVQHGRQPVTVHLSCQTDEVRLAVGDVGARFPDEPGASGGLGLEIVAKTAREWGATPLAVGKQVWCRVPTGSLRARVVPQHRPDLLAPRS
jgi:two-component sensor histidine kinase